MKLKRVFLISLFLMITATFVASSMLFAQENTVLTFAVPSWMVSNLTSSMFNDFEADHPGVQVHLVGSENYYSAGPETDVNAYLDTTTAFASEGDVMMVSNYDLNVMGTRAGNYLDLAPLVAVDSTLNESEFYAPMWQSFQWDGGFWALPLSSNVNFFIYNKTAFDAAGLTYPTENWTFNDFATAVRALTQRDAAGNVTLPGSLTVNESFLLRSWLTHGFYDNTTFPQSPMLDDAELANLVNQWHGLMQEGVVANYDGTQNWNLFDVPLLILQPINLIAGGNRNDLGASLLPGGTAGLELNGIAVSAGTDHPELAYALARYLISNSELVVGTVALAPALQSLRGVRSSRTITLSPVPDEVQALIDQAASDAIPVSEMQFSGYVDQAILNMQTDNLDATAELQNMQVQASQNLQTADARRDSSVVYVSTAVPTPVLSPNETTLRFGMTLMVTPLPNQDEWDQFLADFAAEDPEVGYVELNSNFNGDMTAFAQEEDCLYLPFNAVSSGSIPVLLSVDPFLGADPNFNANDLPPGVLSQLQRDGLTYGVPLTLQPEVLWYDTDLFTNTGIVPPENGWTIDEFEDAMRTLQSSDSITGAPFSPGMNGAGYIMMLIAAYGGMPLDAVSNPPGIHFTDPTNVNAIRQVLDLVRTGYIDYDTLGDYNSGTPSAHPPIYDDFISAVSFATQSSFDGSQATHYRLTSYPRGTQYTPVSYAVGTGYISNTAQNPEACYRFLSALARRPDLLSGMPVNQSLLNDPSFAASVSPDALNFYERYFDSLQDPNVVYVPGNFGTGDSYPGLSIIQLWLYKAFDAYVLDDADLDTVLQQAQSFTESYMQCAVDIPPDNGTQATDDERLARYNAYVDCVVLVDPSLSEMFGR